MKRIYFPYLLNIGNNGYKKIDMRNLSFKKSLNKIPSYTFL